jgi:hypothetical protein
MMTQEVQIHETNTHLVPSVPVQIDAGADITLKVRVSCPHACDLQGKTVQLLAQDGALIKEVSLGSFRKGTNETSEFTAKAPAEVGECTWSVVFPAQDVGDVSHLASSTSIRFTVKAHLTTVIVWDSPSPTPMNCQFTIKVGVKCSAECQLTDAAVEVYDGAGAQVATGRLGATPLPQTSNLYWAEVELAAPANEDVHTWTVKFPAAGLELPHEAASSRFHFRTARPPEHWLTVHVIDKESRMPIKNVHVLAHPFRTFTDAQGVAKLQVPNGKHELYAAKDDYATFQTDIDTSSDAAIEVELVPRPF